MFVAAMSGMVCVAGAVPKADAVPEIITVLTLAPTKSGFRDRFLALKDVIERDFNGGAEVKLLIDGEAGTEETMISAIRRGRAQYAQLTVPGTSGAVPEVALLMAPYLFASAEEADFVLDRYVTAFMQEVFDEKGLAFLGWVESGWWNFFGKTPLIWPKDVENYRLRAAGGDATALYMQALNSDVVPLAFAEMIPALQTGLIAGGATNETMYGNMGIYRYAPHLTLTRHAINPGSILANKAWFEGLSPDNRNVIAGALGTAESLRHMVRSEACVSLAKAAADGAVIHQQTSEQRAAWSAPATAAQLDLVRQIGGRAQDLYDRIVAGKADFAGRGIESKPVCPGTD